MGCETSTYKMSIITNLSWQRHLHGNGSYNPIIKVQVPYRKEEKQNNNLYSMDFFNF